MTTTAGHRLGAHRPSRARHAARPSGSREHRRDALEAFEAAGFPTTRQEAWRFTNMGPVAATAFALAAPDADDAEAFVQAHELRDSAATAVVLNGCFDETLSSYGALPLGVVVQALAASFDDDDSSARDLATALDTGRPSIRHAECGLPRGRRARARARRRGAHRADPRARDHACPATRR